VQRGALYAGGVTQALAEYPGERVKIDALRRAEGLDALAQLQYNDLTVYMPGDILVKVDRASMLASLEVRAPLLDHVVFEFMARVPSRFKLNMNDSKILLKKAVGELLPPAIHNRPKQGFGMPVSSWLKGPLLPLMRETLLGKTARERGMFDNAYVSRMIEEHVRGEGNHYERLWGLLCFELWAQEYLDPA
jgi:asparagine synthase (glutamine-hydrolysing)